MTKKITIFKIIPVFIILCFFTKTSSLSAQHPSFGSDLEPGQVYIVYLDHSGWAVSTQNHFLIFDYWERRHRPKNAGLRDGFINPDEIKDRNVVVFTSHEHSDHYDPVILDWRGKIRNLKYVFGWKAMEGPNFINCEFKRERFTLDEMEVLTVCHNFDRIPESAFLIHIDGITLYYAGDHAHSQGEGNAVYKNNIEYLAANSEKIDLAFFPTFGGHDYMIEKLKPTYSFPMHDGGRELQYKKFAERAERLKLKTKVIDAEANGDAFLFKDGIIKKLGVVRPTRVEYNARKKENYDN
jgi:L-ascorbate metabolism protein UlaG (beta-lactamase superfamily)